jgi:hypothetical protein
MYQQLIWFGILRDDACRLGTAVDSQDLGRLANPLVDRVWRNAELDRDLLRREMLIYQAQAIELSVRQLRYPIRNFLLDFRRAFPGRGIRHSELPLAVHCARAPTPSQR